ncbi:MAG: hypothetical protein Q7L55_08455 [Actinomycetota bacterium]|nr:hypothetical protein [Actinomycetota bacterium]
MSKHEKNVTDHIASAVKDLPDKAQEHISSVKAMLVDAAQSSADGLADAAHAGADALSQAAQSGADGLADNLGDAKKRPRSLFLGLVILGVLSVLAIKAWRNRSV